MLENKSAINQGEITSIFANSLEIVPAKKQP
jgi:hypothetical protein